ncbi:TetR/AcrR family transcriptional regulator [Azorhizobium caulinodans]|uniref:TetR/AcrR family transcriptional regulator n=1 Tax=Azorhizobium caulinodans TaxID=7 RepID=UPI002FBED0B1
MPAKTEAKTAAAKPASTKPAPAKVATKKLATKTAVPVKAPAASAPARAKVAATAKAVQEALRSRLDPKVRRQMILDAAVAFFAEKGFEAQTRDLASRLGISQGLIFRYFSTKQALVNAVYEEVFVQRWSKDWEARLKDRDIPLEKRLQDFYGAYLEAVDASHWIRISLYAGLAGSEAFARYLENHGNRLLKIIQKEIHAHRGLPDRTGPDALDQELSWMLHSTILYALVRKHVNAQPVAEDRGALVALVVRTVLAGAAAGTAAALEAGKAAEKAAKVAKPAEAPAAEAPKPAAPAAKGKARAAQPAAASAAPASRGRAKAAASPKPAAAPKAPEVQAEPAKPAAAKAASAKSASAKAAPAKAAATKAAKPITKVGAKAKATEKAPTEAPALDRRRAAAPAPRRRGR